MIDRDDHPKVTCKQIRMDMITGRIEEEIKDSIVNQNSNSESEDQEILIGKYHYKCSINGEIEHEYVTEAVTKNLNDFKLSMEQIGEQILNGEITITIERNVEFWDDVPSPTQDEIENAIRIMDQSNTIEIEVPEHQITDEPSWD